MSEINELDNWLDSDQDFPELSENETAPASPQSAVQEISDFFDQTEPSEDLNEPLIIKGLIRELGEQLEDHYLRTDQDPPADVPTAIQFLHDQVLSEQHDKQKISQQLEILRQAVEDINKKI